MKNSLFFLLFFVCSLFFVQASPVTVPGGFTSSFKTTESLNTPSVITHAEWDFLLKKYVSAEGKVNYAGLKQDKAKLEVYLKKLSTNVPAADWSKNDKLAFWINVYNAFTVKLIVDNYPLKSIRDLGEPWDKKFILIGTTTYSLNDIEHNIIRKDFAEPRIHFAVNCASFSCPALLNEAYTAEKLEDQLTRQTKAYINNPAHNSITSAKSQVSQLFSWYGDDFKKSAGSVSAFINKYSPVKIKDDSKLEYKEYVWSLNE
ncbi:MAG: DUF547 domain-containing protein [Bacteroidia bacterium]|nr:DUF547 domain-containing protein [Bacteroidia bacterium]